jgi:cell fate regulator YaaT (PSP1 superfamily)
MKKMICVSRGCTFHDDEESGNTSCTALNSCFKLDVTDWMSELEAPRPTPDIAEVRFKNTRKNYYIIPDGMKLLRGDIVAVEASPGHDIGIVSITGSLVLDQMRKYKISPEKTELKKVFRKAKSTDIQKWKESIALEETTMIKARQIAKNLKLEMKIGDVEYQGDKTKAIFYYIADERVDFRELIKVLADEFHVRIEMKQIGARQEAGRIGSIAPCGRELCCTNWMTNFVSVTTGSARDQDLSLNPQKLAGQCSKLKCCLNYEADVYRDARKNFPERYELLEMDGASLYHFKTDIFKQQFWYSHEKDAPVNLISFGLDKVKEILELNQKNIRPPLPTAQSRENSREKEHSFTNVVGQESLTRFDKKKSRNKKRKNRNNPNRNAPQNNNPAPPQA